MSDPFAFDTSGQVWDPERGLYSEPAWITWDDLSPGVQGCVAAVLEGMRIRKGCESCGGRGEIGGWVGQTAESGGYDTELCPDCIPGFSDLHPVTLERIKADWARFCQVGESERFECIDNTVEHGRRFWRMRNTIKYGDKFVYAGDDFPPLTPYLDDNGQVIFVEKAR